MSKSAIALSAAIPLFLLLSACDRSDPPVKRLERAAEELVTEVEGEELPAQLAGPWAPRDECASVTGGPEFLASLRSAVEARDADALLALAADDVKLDFGGGAGKAQLREQLDSDDGAYWDMLTQLLELGCAAQDESTMTMPWYFAQSIPVDPYAGWVVMGQDVPLRNAPSADADVLTQLSWNAVQTVSDTAEHPQYQKVSWTDPASGDAIEGYVRTSHLRSIIDYRLLAARRNNRWSIVSLIAGD